MHAKIFFLICFFSFFSFHAQASETDIPKELQFHLRDAPVKRFELTPFVGDYLGDKFSHSFHTGAHFDYRITPAISVGSEFGWSQIQYDASSKFGSLITNDHLYSFQGNITFNIPAAFLSKKTVIESEIFTSLGGGILRINSSNRPSGFLGGGIKIYFPRCSWLGLRASVRNYFSTVQTTSGTKFSSDLSFSVGPMFLFGSSLK
ncbi:MAG: hypothetical protein COV43_03380 [Deltaproteobacteria bacterium CG11_big_fil_rev_8_21_14_0_20_42_23]|nr:MAG: hypothetical protein COV43_03380 [Deltaproteobacteria bacterium CG11_big_fil_rev_8_21_14_0_20_42_23]PJC63818.1 MAG: hypothetical protein CO021_07995 [Deltaproteobacteria bacterium CG_4_9_14_0_2_um_filter_42_21]